LENEVKRAHGGKISSTHGEYISAAVESLIQSSMVKRYMRDSYEKLSLADKMRLGKAISDYNDRRVKYVKMLNLDAGGDPFAELYESEEEGET
jgi:hypothetical protein